MYKKIALLGSTGSIGTQALDVARMQGYQITALAAHHNVQLMEAQIREFHPNLAVLVDESAAKDLKARVADTGTKVLAGLDGLCACAGEAEADTVLNAVVGMVGLAPTLAAIHAKKTIALANKETLVAGGHLVMDAAKEYHVSILPVDSEHSAIFQCLQGSPRKEALKKIILTASGGPFYGKKREELEAITPAQALRHPNWNMGAKISIDSATMMNKGLELIEAVWLFDVPPQDVDIVVHRESVVHSLIEYQDNSVIAQLGVPDMRIPIQYALTYPERVPSPVKALSLSDYGTLTFHAPDYETFQCIHCCRKAISLGGLYPAAANSANEQAVQLFLDGKIGFLDIGHYVEAALQRAPKQPDFTVEDIFEVDRNMRSMVVEMATKN